SSMPLSEDVRHELAGVEPQKHCDRLAELSGLFHTAGSLHLRGHGEFAVHLDLAESAVARRAVGLVRGFGVEAEIRTYARRAFAGGTRYQLHVAGGPRALEVLHEAGVLSSSHAPLEAPPKRVVGRSCCRRAYLRGALLGGGSVSGPRAPGGARPVTGDPPARGRRPPRQALAEPAGDRRASPAPPVRLAPRARREMPAAGDESRCAPAPEQARQPGRT